MIQAMRRKDRELSRSEAIDILTQGDYGVLSVNGDDYAYGIPMSYIYINNSLYFHCATEGKKLTYIHNDNKVTFCVVRGAVTVPDKFSMNYHSAIAFGTLAEVSDAAEKYQALLGFVEKYSPDYREEGIKYADRDGHKTIVFKLALEHLTGKARR